MATAVESVIDLDGDECLGEPFDGPDNEELLRDLCTDYAQYMNIDLCHREKVLDDAIEEMLLRLDEFVALIDVIRSDSSQCLNRTLPAIYRKFECFNEIKEKIDKLEIFVKLVDKNLTVVEKKVILAEQELRHESSIEKVLKLPFFKKERQAQQRPRQKPTFDKPEIFRTSDYFPPETSNENINEEESKSDEASGGSA